MIETQDWLAKRCTYQGRYSTKEDEFCRLMVSVPQAVGLIGGAGGGTKSHTLRTLAVWILGCLRQWGFPGQSVMLSCCNYPLLQGRQIGKLVEEFSGMGEYRASHGIYGRSFIFDDTSLGRILLRNLDEPGKYRGTECAASLVDELTELPEAIGGEDTISTLRYPIRSPRPLPILPFAGASNPDGVGWRWIKALWIDRKLEEYKLAPEQVFFVQALVTDNPAATPAMIATLDALRGHLYRARRWGDWDAPMGARWQNLDETEHRFDFKTRWPSGLPSDWRKLVGHDWGKRAPYCTLWFTIEPDTGDVYCYREVYEAGVDTDVQAKRVRDMTGQNEVISVLRFDPSMWNATQSDRVDEPGDPLISYFEDVLLEDDRFESFEEGYNRHRSVALATYDKLLTRDNGYPNLYIERGCENFWDELKGATWPKGTALLEQREDIDQRNPDHAITAGYYALHAEIEPFEASPDDTIDGKAAWVAMDKERYERTVEKLTKRNTLFGRR